MANAMKCGNHPTRDAFLKCNQCWKPLCRECAIKTPYGIFCSEECSAKGKEFKDKLNQNPVPAKKGWVIEKIIKLVVLLLILFGVYIYIIPRFFPQLLNR